MEQSRSSLYDDNDVLCFLSNLLDALSGNMGGALFLVKVCKNICSSLLGDKLIVCFYDCFAF